MAGHLLDELAELRLVVGADLLACDPTLGLAGHDLRLAAFVGSTRTRGPVSGLSRSSQIGKERAESLGDFVHAVASDEQVEDLLGCSRRVPATIGHGDQCSEGGLGVGRHGV